MLADRLKNFFRQFGVYFLIFIVIFCVRLYAINSRTAFFIDDVFTFISSTPNNLTPEGNIAKKSWDNFINFENDKYYRAIDVKKSLFGFDPSVKSIVKDLKTMRTANIDRQHTNLYYSIFRIWASGVDGSDMGKMQRCGRYLNLVFFLLSFFFMYKLLSLIKDDKYFISFGLIFAFVSTSSISLNLLIREYALQELFFIVVNYIFLLFYKKIRENQTYKLKDIILYSFGFALFILSSYFSIIYAILLLGTMLLISLYHKNLYAARYVIYIAIVSIAIVLLVYPSYFDFCTNNEHYINVVNNASNCALDKFHQTFDLVWLNIKQYLFYPAFLFTLVITLITNSFFDNVLEFIKNKFCVQKIIPLLIIIFLSFIFALVNMKIAPYNEFRYIAVSNISFSIMIAIFVYLVKKSYLQYFFILLYFILTISVFYRSVYLVPTPYLYDFFNPNMKKVADAYSESLPVVFDKSYWGYSNYILYLQNNQSVKFIKNRKNANLPEKYILVTREYIPDIVPLSNIVDDYAYIIEKD